MTSKPRFLTRSTNAEFGDSVSRLSSDVVDGALFRLHATDVLLQADNLVSGSAGVVAEEFGQLLAVGGVLVDGQLEVLGELLVELLEVVLVLGNLTKHRVIECRSNGLPEQFQALLDQCLADDLEHLRLLEHFTGDVQRQVFGVDDSLDEVEVVRHQVFTVVHDEDTADVQLDGVFRLLVLEQVKWSTFVE